MRYLPINLDTKDKNVLIIGGGLLALSKIKILLNTELKIYCISDSFVDEIKELVNKFPKKLFIKEEVLTEDFIFFGYDMCLIASNNFELNSAFEKRAIKNKMLYERCDILSNSTFTLPKTIEKEGLVVSLDNNKLNPTITEIIYEDIENLLNKYSYEKIKILNKIRSELVRKNSPHTDEIIRELYEKEKLTLDIYLKNLTSDENEDAQKLKENIINTNSTEDIKNVIQDVKPSNKENIDA